MKKIIAVLIAALTISSFGLIANAEESSYLLGDTNKSGEATLNSADLAYLKKVLLGTATDLGMSNVNEDKNGDVDILDLVCLKKLLSRAENSGLALTNGVNEITDNWN